MANQLPLDSANEMNNEWNLEKCANKSGIKLHKGEWREPRMEKFAHGLKRPEDLQNLASVL
jgi:hypothetical protein